MSDPEEVAWADALLRRQLAERLLEIQRQLEALRDSGTAIREALALLRHDLIARGSL